MLILLCERGVGATAAITTSVLARDFLLDQVRSSEAAEETLCLPGLLEVGWGFWKARSGFHFASFYIKESFYSCKFTL